MRIRVSDVLDLLAAGLSAEQILEEMPELEMDDLKATLLDAARKLDHPVLVARKTNHRAHREHRGIRGVRVFCVSPKVISNG